MTGDDFLAPKLNGTRFDGAKIPLDMLRDLGAIDGIIRECARAAFLARNPDRKRVPAGFLDELILSVSEIRDGSAIPVINLAVAGALLFSRAMPYVETAKEMFLGALANPESNRLPPAAIAHFNAFGRSLRPNESITFSWQGEDVIFDSDLRHRILVASPSVTTISDHVRVVGQLFKVDKANGSFSVKLSDGRVVSGPITKDHVKPIVQSLDGFEDGVRVRVIGLGLLTKQNKLESIEEIERIDLLEPMDMVVQLEKLKLLKNGWFDGEGTAFDATRLDRLAREFERHYSEDLPGPYVYPIVDGGVRLEWTIGDYEPSLDINLFHLEAEWHCWNRRTNEDVTQNIDLGDDEGWERLNQLLRECSGLT